MKKNILVAKGMAMLMVCAMVVGNNGMVAHATEYDDGCVRSENEAGGYDGSSMDIGGGSSDSGSSGSSSSGGGSSDSGSSYSGGGSSDSGSSNSGNYSYDSGSGNSGSSNSSASYSAPAPKAAGSTASAGKETFRAVAKAGDGTYKVIHKGIDIATFTLMDTESKKAVSCTKVTLKKRDDGKYAINFEVADATGLTVGAPLDRTYLYSTLGISYVTIGDDNIVINIEEEAQAAATK